MTVSATAGEMIMSLMDKGLTAEFVGTKQGRQKSVRMYRCAAVRGDSKAQFMLALAYASGLGIRKNHRMAMAWFKRAAQSGEELCELAVSLGEQSIMHQVHGFKRLLNEL